MANPLDCRASSSGENEPHRAGTVQRRDREQVQQEQDHVEQQRDGEKAAEPVEQNGIARDQTREVDGVGGEEESAHEAEPEEDKGEYA